MVSAAMGSSFDFGWRLYLSMCIRENIKNIIRNDVNLVNLSCGFSNVIIG